MSQSAVLVESVAQALSWAINDPSGHQNSWNSITCRNFVSGTTSAGKRRRGVEETKQATTVFDSSAIPPIGIDKYLMRLFATFRCSDATFIAALVVVDRLLEYDGGRLPLTMRNVHRVFLASLVVAVKYHEDLVYSNSHYAKAGGVHLREVNRLERVLLSALDFDLRIEPEQYQLYEATLLKLSAARSELEEQQLPTATCAGAPQCLVAAPAAAGPAASTSTVAPGNNATTVAAGGSDQQSNNIQGNNATTVAAGGSDQQSNNIQGTKAAVLAPSVPTGEPSGRTCTPWVPPPQGAILGQDVAVMVAATARDSIPRGGYLGHGVLMAAI